MKMMHMIHRMLLSGLVLAIASGSAHTVAAEEPAKAPSTEAQPQQGVGQGGNKWDAAGHEVKEASGAVSEATKETAGTAWDALKTESMGAWEKTKSGSRELADTVGDKSKEAWQVTKEETKGFWEAGKAKIHEVTAPDRPVAPAAPAPPVEPAAAPLAPVEAPASTPAQQQ